MRRPLSCSLVQADDHAEISLLYPTACLGSWNGNLVVWSMEGVDPSSANGATLRPLTMFEGHSGPLNAVGYNPKFHMMASGANELVRVPDLLLVSGFR